MGPVGEAIEGAVGQDGVVGQRDPLLDRAVEEWVALFNDPILANGALDRFAHRARQIVMEGPSLRASRTRRSPKGGHRPGDQTDSGRWETWVAAPNVILEALSPHGQRCRPRGG